MTKIRLNSFTPIISLRLVVIGSFLIPLNNHFIMWNHLKYWSTLPTTISLIYNVVITLTILVSLNFFLQVFAPNFTFQRGEFMTIYTMLSIGSALTGHDMIQTVMPTILVCYAWKWMETAFLATSSSSDGCQGFFDSKGILWWRQYVLQVSLFFHLGSTHHLVDSSIDYLDWNYDLPFRNVKKTMDSKRTFSLSYYSITIGDYSSWWTVIPVEDDVAGFCHFRKHWSYQWSKHILASFATNSCPPSRNWSIPDWKTLECHRLDTILHFVFFCWSWIFDATENVLFRLVFLFFWKFERVLGQTMGISALPWFPYERSQVMGGYLVLAIMLVYS